MAGNNGKDAQASAADRVKHHGAQLAPSPTRTTSSSPQSSPRASPSTSPRSTPSTSSSVPPSSAPTASPSSTPPSASSGPMLSGESSILPAEYYRTRTPLAPRSPRSGATLEPTGVLRGVRRSLRRHSHGLHLRRPPRTPGAIAHYQWSVIAGSWRRPVTRTPPCTRRCGVERAVAAASNHGWIRDISEICPTRPC